MITEEERKGIIEKFKVHSRDTGSPEVQIALLTSRVTNLTEHLKTHRKDKHSRRGLIMMVAHRRKLLMYLSQKSPSRYQQLIGTLGIRGI